LAVGILRLPEGLNYSKYLQTAALSSPSFETNKNNGTENVPVKGGNNNGKRTCLIRLENKIS
jgi:hypothetical protein